MPKALVEIIGDATSYVHATRQAVTGNEKLISSVKELKVNVESAAAAQVSATVKKQAKLREEIAAYQQLASSAKRGSAEQIAAANHAAQAQARLSRSLGVSAHESRQLASSSKVVERDFGKTARGALSASVGIRGMGRSLAFASGYFLGGAGLVYGLKASVEAGESLEKSQRSLAVTIRKTGGNVAETLPGIERWAKAQVAVGVTAVQAEQGLARASAVTGSAAKGQRAYTEALLISKATGRNFNSVLIAAAKANNGSTTALARYIGKIKAGTSAQKLYNDVVARYKGQAEANTTASEKLSASLANIEATVGTALLPTINKLADSLTKWLDKSKNQERIQRDVNRVIGAAKSIFSGLAGAIKHIDQVTGGFKKTLELLLALKVVSVLSGWATAFTATGAAATAAGGEVAILRGRLKALATLAPILITIDIIENLIPRKWKTKGQKILEGDGVGFLGKLPLGIGTDLQVGALAGRNAKNAVFGGGSNKPRMTKNEIEAFNAGKTGDAFPFPFSDPSFSSDFAAYARGRKDGGNAIGSKTDQKTSPKVTPKVTPKGVSLQGQLNLSDLAVAEAATTKGTADDLAALRKRAAILRALIAKGGTLAQQTQRNQDLGGTLDQIQAILTPHHKKTVDLAKKRLAAMAKADRELVKGFSIQLTNAKSSGQAAQLKVLNAERDALQKRLKVEKGNQMLQQALADTQQKIAAIVSAQKQKMQQALDSARQVVGELGQGPVATGPSAQFLQQYGGHLNAQAFTQDVAAQNRQANGFIKNLSTLKKRGASSSLIQTLLGQGQGGMDEASALAHASKKNLAAFLAVYDKRQRVLQRVARMEVTTPVVHVQAKTVNVGAGRTDAHDRATGKKFGRTVNSGRRG